MGKYNIPDGSGEGKQGLKIKEVSFFPFLSFESAASPLSCRGVRRQVPSSPYHGDVRQEEQSTTDGADGNKRKARERFVRVHLSHTTHHPRHHQSSK